MEFSPNVYLLFEHAQARHNKDYGFLRIKTNKQKNEMETVFDHSSRLPLFLQMLMVLRFWASSH